MIVKKFDDILALDRLDADASLSADVNTFLDQCLNDFAGFTRTGCLTECADKNCTHTRECCVDEQLAPACSDEVLFNVHCAHVLKYFLHLVEVSVLLR